MRRPANGQAKNMKCTLDLPPFAPLLYSLAVGRRAARDALRGISSRSSAPDSDGVARQHDCLTADTGRARREGLTEPLRDGKQELMRLVGLLEAKAMGVSIAHLVAAAPHATHAHHTRLALLSESSLAASGAEAEPRRHQLDARFAIIWEGAVREARYAARLMPDPDIDAKGEALVW